MDALALFLFKTNPNSSRDVSTVAPFICIFFPLNTQPRNIQNPSHPVPPDPERAIPPLDSLHCKAEANGCLPTEKPPILTFTHSSAASTHRTPPNGTVLRHPFPQIHSTPQQHVAQTNRVFEFL